MAEAKTGSTSYAALECQRTDTVLLAAEKGFVLIGKRSGTINLSGAYTVCDLTTMGPFCRACCAFKRFTQL